MPKISIILITLILIFLGGCSDDPTTSAVVEEPGSRNYTWAVDTMNLPLKVLTRISATSWDNVWAVGGGGELKNSIHHFDGKKWNCDSISRPIAPFTVHAVSKNDVWIGDTYGLIWHYNGRTWGQYTKLEVPGYNYVSIQNIWGDSPDNIFATGSAVVSLGNLKACMFHYDGSSWKVCKLPDMPLCSFLNIRRDPSKNNMYYIGALKFTSEGGFDSTYIFEYDGMNTKRIFAANFEDRNLTKINALNGKLYILLKNLLLRYENGSYKVVYQVKNPDILVGFIGKSTRDIFFMAHDGIVHYNGSDEQYLYGFDRNKIVIDGYAECDDGIFFIAYGMVNELNLIIRGKLSKQN